MKAFYRVYVVAAAIAVFLITVGCTGTGVAKSGGSPAPEQAEVFGEKLFARYCSSCHSTLPDTVIVGPSLAWIASRADTRVAGVDAETYLRTSILSPKDYIVEGFNDLMPNTFSTTLSLEEQDALVAYLLTLK